MVNPTVDCPRFVGPTECCSPTAAGMREPWAKQQSAAWGGGELRGSKNRSCNACFIIVTSCLRVRWPIVFSCKFTALFHHADNTDYGCCNRFYGKRAADVRSGIKKPYICNNDNMDCGRTSGSSAHRKIAAI